MSFYKEDLISRYWQYQKQNFPDSQEYFERSVMSNKRPPVFLKHTATNNIIMEPGISTAKRKQLLDIIPPKERHLWFRSMNSSQAIAQSVLGNLKVYDCLHYLGELADESGESVLGGADVASVNFSMEYAVDCLGEPRPTSLDGFFSGSYRVAIECKFTENEVG